jgi:hypothetical protein
VGRKGQQHGKKMPGSDPGALVVGGVHVEPLCVGGVLSGFRWFLYLKTFVKARKQLLFLMLLSAIAYRWR